MPDTIAGLKQDVAAKDIKFFLEVVADTCRGRRSRQRERR